MNFLRQISTFAIILVLILGISNAYPLTSTNVNEAIQIDLFPVINPFDEGHLKVSDIHNIWYAQYGNPKGIPIVFLHGGPGSGTSPKSMRYFDPKFYRIILLDQRGSGRSKPFGETKENTTTHLVNDIEVLRNHLNVEKWLLFGGSWGTTLALAYGEAYPNRCLGFILRGIFLGRKKETDQFFYGMKDCFPEAWNEFQEFIPPEERSNLLKAYYNRIMDPDPKINISAAFAFLQYDGSCESLVYSPKTVEDGLKEEKDTLLQVARIYITYCMNNFYIKENQLLENLHKIKHLPAIIINGRYDAICRSNVAFELHKNWPGSELRIAEKSGHSASEPEIRRELLRATNMMKKMF